MPHPFDRPHTPLSTASHHSTSPLTVSTHRGTERRSTTTVLLDPTSPDGHSALSLLADRDTDVLLVMLMTGRVVEALRGFAHRIGAGISEAGWTYLDQVAVGLETAGRSIGTIAATGHDTAETLAEIAIGNDADRVALPSSIRRFDPDVPDRLARLAPVTVVMPEFRTLSTVG